jgi:hypothetical protein
MAAYTAVNYASHIEDIHKRNRIEEAGDTSDLLGFIEMLNKKMLLENAPAFRKPDRVTIAPAKTILQDMETKAARAIRALVGHENQPQPTKKNAPFGVDPHAAAL